MLKELHLSADVRSFENLGFLHPGALACLYFLITAAGWFGAGCSNRTSPDAAIPNQPSAWTWEAYPQSTLIRLAILPCQIVPNSILVIPASQAGILRVYANQPQTNLPAQFVWAEFEPAAFATEAQALEKAKQKLEERERLHMELELPRQKLRYERELETSARQLALLHLLATNEQAAKLSFDYPGIEGSPLRPEALANAQIEYEILSRSLDYVRQTNWTMLGIDLPGQRADWERRKLEFDRRQDQARLRMPFDGQLTVSLPLTYGVNEFPVSLGQELAVARDISSMRLRVALSNPAWAGLPTHQIEAVIRLPNGRQLNGRFAFKKTERLQLREESAYYFQISSECSAAAATLLGMDVSCEIWLTLPRPSRIVPKLALVLHRPAAFENSDWARGIADGWPGARVLAEGQTEFAIVAPENELK